MGSNFYGNVLAGSIIDYTTPHFFTEFPSGVLAGRDGSGSLGANPTSIRRKTRLLGRRAVFPGIGS